ncbi:hypothetical protein M9H77_30054 [Catharanthus roseus]|uniref:Uncharacterized protein n=1 Tax=Catharanthus roseus TaxID=4058 RepID=A0ACB9ZXH4_CATRO|nr:hypothetical protein M9H77_30054 [Catharanthus roseus]
MGSIIRWSRVATYLILLANVISVVAATTGEERVAVETFESGRHLLKKRENALETVSQSDDTLRADPFDNLKKYRGGYDITNKHYWSSTVFTGIYGYSIALLWFLCGLAYGGFLSITKFCCKYDGRKLKQKRSPCHRPCYFWLVLIAVFFTFLAIIGSGLVLGGNAKFHSRAKKVVDILIDTADDASDTIYRTTGAMKDMSISLATTNESGEVTRFLTSTSRSLNSQAANIRRQARKNRKAIDKGLKIVYIITTVTISLNLVATISLSGLLSSAGFLQFYAGCSLESTSSWQRDTCTAFEGFQKNPYNNSLSSILPCDELTSAKSVLTGISAEIHDIVNEARFVEFVRSQMIMHPFVCLQMHGIYVNRNISTNFGNIVQICNPFSAPPQYEYQPKDCAENSIQIGKIPELLKLLTCPDSEPCIGGIIIPTRDYNLVEAYTSSIQKLLNVYPGMESLVECQIVTDAFSEILKNHCEPLKRYTKMVWATLVFLSVVMVALVLTWTGEARHEEYHHSLDASVKPCSAAADTLELGTVNASSNDSNL